MGPRGLLLAPLACLSLSAFAGVAQADVVMVGLPKLTAAKARLRAARCKVGLVSRGRGVKAAIAKVVASSPKTGTALPVGTAISLKLG